MQAWRALGASQSGIVGTPVGSCKVLFGVEHIGPLSNGASGYELDPTVGEQVVGGPDGALFRGSTGRGAAEAIGLNIGNDPRPVASEGVADPVAGMGVIVTAGGPATIRGGEHQQGTGGGAEVIEGEGGIGAFDAEKLIEDIAGPSIFEFFSGAGVFRADADAIHVLEVGCEFDDPRLVVVGGPMGGERKTPLIRVAVILNREAYLFEVVGTLGSSSRRPDLHDGRQQQ